MTRTTRAMSANQKKKISNALRGRTVSDTTRQRQSDAMRAYWLRIPKAPKPISDLWQHSEENNNETNKEA